MYIVSYRVYSSICNATITSTHFESKSIAIRIGIVDRLRCCTSNCVFVFFQFFATHSNLLNSIFGCVSNIVPSFCFSISFFAVVCSCWFFLSKIAQQVNNECEMGADTDALGIQEDCKHSNTDKRMSNGRKKFNMDPKKG